MTTAHSKLEENGELTIEEQELKKMFPDPTYVAYGGFFIIIFIVVFMAILIMYNALMNNYIENHDSVYYSYISTQPDTHNIKNNTEVNGYIIIFIVSFSIIIIISMCSVIGTFMVHYYRNYKISVEDKIICSGSFLIFIISLMGAILLDILCFKFDLVQNVWIFSVENIATIILVALMICYVIFVLIIITIIILLLLLFFVVDRVEWVKIVVKSKKDS